MSEQMSLDFKAAHINAFGGVVKSLASGELENISLPKKSVFIIVTQSSYITAEIFDTSPETYANGEFKFDSTEAQKLVVNTVYKEVSGIFQNGSKTPSPIYLKNAVVRSFANNEKSVRFEFLCIYSDQVLGISLGQVD